MKNLILGGLVFGGRSAKPNNALAFGLLIGLLMTVNIGYAQSVLPKVKRLIESRQDAKVLIVGDSVVGSYGVYVDEGWTYRLAELINIYVNRPGGPGPMNVRYYFRSVQADASGSVLGDATDYGPVSFSSVPGAPTITIIRDGVGGNNILRLLARIQSINRFPLSAKVNEGLVSGGSDGIIVSIGINDSFDEKLGPAWGMSAYAPSRPIFGLVGLRDLQIRGTDLDADFDISLDNVVKLSRAQQMITGATPEFALATPIDVRISVGGVIPAKINAVRNRINMYTSTHAAEGCATLDLAAIDLASPYDMVDDYHPSATGHSRIAERVFEAILGKKPISQPVNGNFESPPLPDKTFIYGAPLGWDYFGTAGVSRAGSGFTDLSPAIPLGQQVAFLQNDGRITQQIRLVPGEHVRFRATQRKNWGTGFQQIAVFIDGVQQRPTITPGDGFYTVHDIPLSVPVAGSHLLEFRGVVSGPLADVTAFIDNMSMGW